MQCHLSLAAAAVVAAAVPALCEAQTPEQRRPVDSTGIVPGVVRTLQLPAPTLSSSQIKNFIDDTITQNGVINGLPPGYVEQSSPMGPHALAETGTYALYYYLGLGYPVVPYSVYEGQPDPCNGDLTPRVMYLPAAGPVCTGGGESGDSCSGPTPARGYVCEPQGTRTVLVKKIGAQLLTVTQGMLDQLRKPNTVGMSVQTATSVCQAKGYTNYVDGSVSYTQAYDCGYRITRWNGSAFYDDNACYNYVMHGLQCWR